jgi:hypothetical protein
MGGSDPSLSFQELSDWEEAEHIFAVKSSQDQGLALKWQKTYHVCLGAGLKEAWLEEGQRQSGREVEESLLGRGNKMCKGTRHERRIYCLQNSSELGSQSTGRYHRRCGLQEVHRKSCELN